MEYYLHGEVDEVVYYDIMVYAVYSMSHCHTSGEMLLMLLYCRHKKMIKLLMS